MCTEIIDNPQEEIQTHVQANRNCWQPDKGQPNIKKTSLKPTSYLKTQKLLFTSKDMHIGQTGQKLEEDMWCCDMKYNYHEKESFAASLYKGLYRNNLGSVLVLPPPPARTMLFTGWKWQILWCTFDEHLYHFELYNG